MKNRIKIDLAVPSVQFCNCNLALGPRLASVFNPFPSKSQLLFFLAFLSPLFTFSLPRPPLPSSMPNTASTRSINSSVHSLSLGRLPSLLLPSRLFISRHSGCRLLLLQPMTVHLMYVVCTVQVVSLWDISCLCKRGGAKKVFPTSRYPVAVVGDPRIVPERRQDISFCSSRHRLSLACRALSVHVLYTSNTILCRNLLLAPNDCLCENAKESFSIM